MTNRGMISEPKYRIELGGRGCGGRAGGELEQDGMVVNNGKRVNNYIDEGRERANRERESEGERGNRNPGREGIEGEK